MSEIRVRPVKYGMFDPRIGRLIPLYEQLHRSGKYYDHGGTVSRYVEEIARIISEVPTETILDYGCGGAINYTVYKMHERWGGIMPTLYDPAVRCYNTLPLGQFDGVICTGVLEHIPEDELPEAFELLSNYAQKWCFLLIGCKLSKKRLPDGSQPHVTLRPRDWWWEMIANAFKIDDSYDVEAMHRRRVYHVASNPIRIDLAWE